MRYAIVAVLLAVLCGGAFAEIILDDFPDPVIPCPVCCSKPVLVVKHSGKKFQVRCPNRCVKTKSYDGVYTAEWYWNAQVTEQQQGD